MQPYHVNLSCSLTQEEKNHYTSAVFVSNFDILFIMDICTNFDLNIALKYHLS